MKSNLMYEYFKFYGTYLDQIEDNHSNTSVESSFLIIIYLNSIFSIFGRVFSYMFLSNLRRNVIFL